MFTLAQSLLLSFTFFRETNYSMWNLQIYFMSESLKKLSLQQTKKSLKIVYIQLYTNWFICEFVINIYYFCYVD